MTQSTQFIMHLKCAKKGLLIVANAQKRVAEEPLAEALEAVTLRGPDASANVSGVESKGPSFGQPNGNGANSRPTNSFFETMSKISTEYSFSGPTQPLQSLWDQEKTNASATASGFQKSSLSTTFDGSQFSQKTPSTPSAPTTSAVLFTSPNQTRLRLSLAKAATPSLTQSLIIQSNSSTGSKQKFSV